MEIKAWTYEEYPGYSEEVPGAVRLKTTGDEVGVRYLHDVEYARVDDVPLHLQILLPFTRNEPDIIYPCLVFVQGSAWKMCIRDSDRRMRFVGDAAAIVAGETEKAVDRALKIIKVKYKVLEPVLDFHKAKDNAVCIHPEDNWESRFPVGADNKRNLLSLIHI